MTGTDKRVRCVLTLREGKGFQRGLQSDRSVSTAEPLPVGPRPL